MEGSKDVNRMDNISKIDRIRSKVIGSLADAAKVYRWCDNWYDVYLFRLGIKKKLFMKVEGDKRVEINSVERLGTFLSSGEHLLHRAKSAGIEIKDGVLLFDYKGRKVSLNFNTRDELVHTLHMVSEQFIREQYGMLDVKGRDVVDVGASIGDTAIYFALNGAKHVYAFEPSKSVYDLAVKNVRSNGLGDRITMINESCGSGGDALPYILRKYKIGNAVLKSDCEGCEYGLILNADSTVLRSFGQIMLEYHYGYLDIASKLKISGFAVNHTMPRAYSHRDKEGRQSALGLIYARLTQK